MRKSQIWLLRLVLFSPLPSLSFVIICIFIEMVIVKFSLKSDVEIWWFWGVNLILDLVIVIISGKDWYHARILSSI